MTTPPPGGLTLADLQAMISSSSGQSSQNAYQSSPDPTSLIYLGKKKTPTSKGLAGPYRNESDRPQYEPAAGPFVGNRPNVSTGDDLQQYAQARLAPTAWDADQLKQFVNNGIIRKIPGFQAGMGMPEIVDAWDELLKASFAFNQNNPNGKKWSPYDIMDTYSQTGKFGTIKSGDWLIDAATGERIKYVGPKTKTQTSRSVDLSSAEDVKALTTQVLTAALGRAPTSAEVAQYKSTINSQEQSNPTVSTQTQTLNDMGEVSNTSTTTSGGVSADAQQQLVLDQAKQGPEYGKYQSATTYYNAMMQMLSGGG